MGIDRKLTYGRQYRELELNSGRPLLVKQSQREDNVFNTSIRALAGYEKTDGVLSYSIVCVISGGERKEKVFLQELITQKSLHSIRVAFLSKENQGLQPYQMQDAWLRIQQKGEVDIAGQRYILDEMDKFFLLSDVDEFYDQLVKICNEHGKNDKCQWIISNPCFEIWLYYCFKNKPKEDLAILQSLSVDKRSQELKRLGNDVVLGGLNPCKCFEKMNEGIQNSMEHYEEDSNSIPILYATQMCKMAQYLIDSMNRNANEYNEFLKRKREWRDRMRCDK